MKLYKHWDDEMKHWTRFLRDREERNLCCVSSSETPSWSMKLSKIRESLKLVVQDVETTINEDDHDTWKAALFLPSNPISEGAAPIQLTL